MVYTYRIAFYISRNHPEDCRNIPNEEQYLQNRDYMRTLINEIEQVPCERVTITARDGTVLSARYYHVRDGAPVHVEMHGYRGSALRDFCGGNRATRLLGHNALLVDQRAHGESGGRSITFGVKERYDCLDWIGYVQKRFGEDTPIYLAGVSMGAATVLMAAELDLPGTVRGILADSPYSSPEAIIRKVCRDMGYPPALAFPLIRLGARVLGGFDPRECSAVAAVEKTKIPILLIHGEDDRFVPCEMSREIAAAGGERVHFETFPEAGHGLNYIVDTQRYHRVVEEFIAKTEQA